MKKKLMKRLLSGILVAALGLTQMPLGNVGAVQDIVYASAVAPVVDGWGEVSDWTCNHGSVQEADGKLVLSPNEGGANVEFFKKVTLEAGKTYDVTVDVRSDSKAAWLKTYVKDSANDTGKQVTGEGLKYTFKVDGEGNEINLGVAFWIPNGDTCEISSIKVAEVEKPAINLSVSATQTKRLTVGKSVELNATIKGAEGNEIEIPDGHKLYWGVDETREGALKYAQVSITGEGVVSGNAVSANVALNETGVVYVKAELKETTNWSVVASKVIRLETVNANEEQIWVKKVENLSEDFICGADISSYISVVESGAKFRDNTGKVLTDQEFFNLLKDSGINWVRIRIWNDPYDGNKNGYGGGNNDEAKALKMAEYAKNAGIKILLDYHYSDFYADPGKQYAPKAWKDMKLSEKETALYNFTVESLNKFKSKDIIIDMVQVGNETNNGIAGESTWENMGKLFTKGSEAVKAVYPDCKVAIHFTDPQTPGQLMKFAKNLDEQKVPYDVFASSYYPKDHGTMENISKVLNDVASNYGKDVMVAETSWAWASGMNGAEGDGDGHECGFEPGNYSDYAISVQGQANEVRDVVDAVNRVNSMESTAGENTNVTKGKGIGVFYWEPTWIPVQYAYDVDGKLDEEIKANNKNQWEKYGSGVAAEAGMGYLNDSNPKKDDNDFKPESWAGGSVKDNEAFFDFEGYPLQSLTVFKDLRTGKVGSIERVDVIKYAKAEVYVKDPASEHETIKNALPKTVEAVYNNSKREQVSVEWDLSEVDKITQFGNYDIKGVATYSDAERTNATKEVECCISVVPNSLLNNGDFENQDASGWSLINTEDVQLVWNDTPVRGDGAMHFWCSSKMDFSISQTVKAEKAGKYVASMQLQGDGGSSEDDINIKVVNKTRGTSVKENAVLSGWCKWQNPRTEGIDVYAGDELEVIISIKAAAGAWGSVDDAFLYKVGDLENNNGGGSDSGNNSGSTPTTPTTPPTNTKPDTTTETKPDGSTVETKTETKEDGTKVETVTETATDGSKKETVVETKPDGKKVEKITETATDGSKVETKKESETNTAGKQVEVSTVTKTDADGKVASVVEKSTISEVAKNTTATVTVKKDGEGAVTSATASVAATIEGKKTSLSADVIAQVQEASGQKDVTVTVTAKNDEGKTLYKVKVDTKDLTADNALYIYKVDSKTGELVMVNSKTYKVDENGGLDISIKNKATYELVSKAEAKAIEKQIKATVKVQNSSKDVKKGKTTKVAFDKKMNMNNVKSITYQTADKKIATVSKSGKVTAKAKGTVTVKATVTLKNGSKKTVTMKIKVK